MSGCFLPSLPHSLTHLLLPSFLPSLSPFLQEHPTILSGLDMVEEDDQFTHLMSLADDYDGEEILNVFQEDGHYLENEEKYRAD